MSLIRIFFLKRCLKLFRAIKPSETRRDLCRKLLLLFGDYANEIRDERLADFCYQEIYKLAMTRQLTSVAEDPYALTTKGGA